MNRIILLSFIVISIALVSCADIEINAEDLILKTQKDSLCLDVNPAYSKTAKKIDKFFSSRAKRGVFNGAVLFAKDGNVVYKNAFGFSNFRKKDSLTTESSFQLASVSKPLTAFAIMILKEQSKLSYEDSLRKFFPNFPYENITVRQLLTHNSGLPNYMYFADDNWKDRKGAISNKDVIKLMTELEPMRYYKPGKRYNYSNTGYCLLAAIVEKASGKTYEKFMQEEVFKTLEMNNSSVYNKSIEMKNPNEVIGYIKRRRTADNTYLNGVVGDKGIYSSVEDLYRLDQELYNFNLVSEESVKEAFTPAYNNRRWRDNYGLGWKIRTKSDTSIVYHTGWWKGFRSYFIRDIKEKKTVIILTNVSRAGMFNINKMLKMLD